MTGPSLTNPHPTGLQAKRQLLVAEDEWLIVDRIEQALAGSRFEIAGKAASVGQALSLLGAGHFDGAILDGNLAGERTATVATHLRAAGIPFLLLTAYTPDQHLLAWGAAPVLTKPFAVKTLLTALDDLIA